MDIKKMLDGEIEKSLSHIGTLAYGSDERDAAVSELIKLYKLRIDETKNEQDYKKDCERQAMEREFHKADEALKREQMALDRELREAEEKLKRDQMQTERKIHAADETLKRDQMATEIKLHQADETLKRDQMAMEMDIHNAEIESKHEILSGQVIERFCKYGTLALELIVPIVAYGTWYNRGLKFEETGTVTSPMTRNLISRMLPKKK